MKPGMLFLRLWKNGDFPMIGYPMWNSGQAEAD